jgi:polysaccharide deacetylase family protein (PEP-CTERM system associated)
MLQKVSQKVLQEMSQKVSQEMSQKVSQKVSPTALRRNAMTVDVEDYFHVSAFESVIAKNTWDNIELRVERNTYRILALFEQYNVKSTFFVLGWVAKRCPALILAIAQQGHELASHGYSHQRAIDISAAQFKQDVERSKDVVEDISGRAILGYRAPSFSVNDTNPWVYEVLDELGFTYSSSAYPITHDLYGVPLWPRFIHQRHHNVIEIPISTSRKNNKNTGIGGGGYFRLYPYWFSKRRIDNFLNVEQKPYNFYFHPWEIDPGQPRIKQACLKSRIRHYLNLPRMQPKLIRLLEDYQWDTMQKIYLSADLKPGGDVE